MSSKNQPNEILRFNCSSDPIEIKYEKTVTYSNCRTYDHKIMAQGFIWHQIVIQHHGKVSGDNGKNLILDAIFDIVGNEEFFPVAYRHTAKDDKFLVRQCTPAMDKLFASNLRIRLANGLIMSLKVQLNVAEYKFGQISPKTRMAQAIQRLCQNLESLHNECGLLNLSSFGANIELDGLEISLGNRVTLEYICDTIYRDDEHYRFINGIILNHNGIKTVAPLQIFRSTQFSLLDLRFNDVSKREYLKLISQKPYGILSFSFLICQLSSVSNLCRDLQSVKAKKLYLAGNPLTDTTDYPGALKPLIKNFKFIDDTPSENLSKDYTPVSQSDGSEENGFYIDTNNEDDMDQFQMSTDWHGVMIPDPNREFTKEEIFDFFFITISYEFEPIYPCYYKYSSGVHQFLLRKCFFQLKHLVKSCKLEIKIPSLNVTSIDSGPSGVEVMYEKVLKYYLRMNISQFKNGEIDAAECTDKALTRRFNAMDRLLDLDKFQSSPGMREYALPIKKYIFYMKSLENIIVNLSSAKVLESVLKMAAKKFLKNCIEIRLSNNKILSGNFTKAFSLMTNVKAVDLGNNWIHDLEDIKTLQTIRLKALCLDGNPLCSQYALPNDYIDAVRRLFPDMHKLDNIEIQTKGQLNCQKNYLCDVRAYDFVEQFVPYYFNTFQSKERKNLKGLYHPQATFTMTCKYTPSQATEQNMSRRARYRRLSRNVLSMIDMSLAKKNFHFGVGNILSIFSELPNMVFDFISFTIDVPIFIGSMVVIFVNGVLADQPPSLLEGEIVLGFSRTFILTPVKSHEGVLKCATGYQIIHDLFSVYNPSDLQLKNSFKYCKNNDLYEGEELTTTDKEALLIMFQELTGLKSIWCTRCLGDANWSFEEAMTVFAELCDKKEIPPTAFI